MVLLPQPLFYITLIRDANSVSEWYCSHTLECEIQNLKVLPKCVIPSKCNKFSWNCLDSMAP